jgi:hypothetical protein
VAVDLEKEAKEEEAEVAKVAEEEKKPSGYPKPTSED